MKVSTKGRYGARIMLELALHYEERLLTVKAIAEKQGISEKYIEQIISMLNKAGLVRSNRGAAGGYRLAKAPGEITLKQILAVTEGALALVECIAPVNPYGCPRKHECIMVDIWQDVQNRMLDAVGSLTLADLVVRYHEKSGFSYSI